MIVAFVGFFLVMPFFIHYITEYIEWVMDLLET